MAKKGVEMKQNYTLLCLIFTLLFGVDSIAQGFEAGTLVKIPDEYVPIEQIQPGDYVQSYSHGQYVPYKVLRVLSLQEPRYYCLQVQDDAICMSSHQKLYMSTENRWVTVHDIQPGDMLGSNKPGSTIVGQIDVVHEEIQLYDLVVDVEHTFCVSHHDIVVHNFEPISIGLTFLIGAGVIEFVEATIAITLVGFGVGLAWQNNKNGKKEVALKIGENADSVAGSSGSPEDPEDKRKKNEMRKSEFFGRDEIKKAYEYYKDGAYRKRPGAKGIKKVEYLKWDHLHGDVEAYSSRMTHLGSIDPKTLKFYKDAVSGRTL
mgnify:CR=1 FL=1